MDDTISLAAKCATSSVTQRGVRIHVKKELAREIESQPSNILPETTRTCIGCCSQGCTKRTIRTVIVVILFVDSLDHWSNTGFKRRKRANTCPKFSTLGKSFSRSIVCSHLSGSSNKIPTISPYLRPTTTLVIIVFLRQQIATEEQQTLDLRRLIPHFCSSLVSIDIPRTFPSTVGRISLQSMKRHEKVLRIEMVIIQLGVCNFGTLQIFPQSCTKRRPNAVVLLESADLRFPSS